jgi:hypothetical protein
MFFVILRSGIFSVKREVGRRIAIFQFFCSLKGGGLFLKFSISSNISSYAMNLSQNRKLSLIYGALQIVVPIFAIWTYVCVFTIVTAFFDE